MENQSDFEVIQDGTISRLKGHLVDSTNLDDHKTFLSKSKEISLQDLYSVSWLGLQRFYEMVFKFPNKVLLSDIPPHVYRILLLLPSFGKKVGVKSFVIEVFKPNQDKKKISMTIEKLVEIGKKQGCFASLPDGSRISGSLHHLCRPFFNDFQIPHKNFSSKWCIKNEGICNFFYEYACFMRVTLEICSLAQESTARLIEESLQQICMRISNLEFGVKTIDPNFSDYKSRSLMSLMPHIHEVSKSVVIGLNLSSTTFEAVAETFEAIFLSERMVGSELFDQMEYFINFTDQLTPMARSLEDVGVELGDNTLKYGEISSLRKAFETFSGKDLSEKNISTLRRKLKMDQSINLNWEDTLKEIQNEFKLIQNELGRCIVALQGFDLVRQVLEHRVGEVEILKDNFNAVRDKELNWEQLKERILIKIVDRLVTDQEKFSFAFFFPDSTIKQHESKLLNGETFFF
ncbi:hypothetical protein [Fluviispira multicolorata]|uniref:Uncharacterized protein n=1 Tax=Fluviispira multicolorata TaxID=2654512 RepID=A0A833JH81_9BACT|nr:hypothetical protein [Fluviispira multicolorata]KAB8033327.1 hypothetical protein GCL57_01110 [Fluviispira multicolorata]